MKCALGLDLCSLGGVTAVPRTISGLRVWLDSVLGITPSEASVSQDPSTWTQSNCTVAGSSFPSNFVESTDGGATIHNFNTTGANLEAGPATYSVDLTSIDAARNVIIRNSAGKSATFDLQSGSIQAESGATGTITAIAGGYRCTVSLTTAAADTISIRSQDGSFATSYTGDGRTCFSIDAVGVTQQRVAAQADQMGLLDLEQTVTSWQPKITSKGFTFDGVNDFLRHTPTPPPVAFLHQESTIFVAGSKDTPPAYAANLLSTFNGLTSKTGVNIYEYLADSITFRVGNSSGVGLAAAVTLPGDFPDGGYVVTAAIDASTALLRSNGTEATGGVGTLDPGDASDPFYVGAQSGNINYTGEIYEVLLYDRKLTSDEISAVEDYLTAKWGI